MNIFFKTVCKHAIIFTSLVLGILTIVFVGSLFNTPHPDAYIDGVMSIVYVYVIVIFVHVLYFLLKRYTSLNTQAIVEWYMNGSIIVHIALGFAAITIVNNFMMISGYDTPKTGTFAYTHLLIRLLIVSLATSLTMIKPISKRINNMIHKTYNEPLNIKNLMNAITINPLVHSFVLFTYITALGCVFMILFSPIIQPEAGYNLYASLLFIYSIILIYTLIHFYYKLIKEKRGATQ